MLATLPVAPTSTRGLLCDMLDGTASGLGKPNLGPLALLALIEALSMLCTEQGACAYTQGTRRGMEIVWGAAQTITMSGRFSRSTGLAGQLDLHDKVVDAQPLEDGRDEQADTLRVGVVCHLRAAVNAFQQACQQLRLRAAT